MRELQNIIKSLYEQLEQQQEHIRFHKSFHELKNKFYENHSDDWKFNSFHWALDTYKILMSVIYSFVNMKSRAVLYKKNRKKGEHPSNSHPQINFYCDSTMVNLYTCRDKTALMVWSYFHPFDPENKKEVLSYKGVVERLKAPKNFGFNLSKQKNFLKSLNLLGNKNNEFKRLEDFRHYKIHRWEPRIEVFGKQDYQGFPYVTFDYEGQDFNPVLKRNKIKDVIWNYDDVEKNADLCINKMLIALTHCYETFSSLDPYKPNHESSLI